MGVSAQAVGHQRLPGSGGGGSAAVGREERYGTLVHPGDAYSYDIYSQAGRAIGPNRPKTAIDPMGGLEVKRLVAAGASQSAARLRTYINGVHAIEKIFDGYLPYIDFASPVPFASDRSGQRSRISCRIRDDLGAPVFVVNSETETVAYFPSRQPDTDTFRFWEVAGTSHVSVARAAVATTTGLDSPNWLSYTPVYNAALRHLHRWLTTGTAPPVMPPIEVTSGEGVGATIQRDSRGNAVGGVRLPAFAVPSAQSIVATAKRSRAATASPFSTATRGELTAEELAALYDDRGEFMKLYDRALEQAVDAGVVLTEEAPALRETATAWASSTLPAG